MAWVALIVQGVLLGGLYALFAVGLSLVFGVMRLVNIAHGDLIVLLAYLGLVVTQAFGLNPFAALLLLVPASATFGYVLQWGLYERTLGRGPLPPLLVSFGLAVVIENALLLGFGADSQKLSSGAIESASITLMPGLTLGILPLLTLLAAVLAIAGIEFMVYRTAYGRLLRAVSDDEAGARLVGIDARRVYRLAMTIALAVTAVAAMMMATRANFDPSAGPARLIFAFEAVVIGGLGSLWGTLVGGIVLGVAQMVGAQFDATWQVLAGHLVFLAVLVVRPEGLFQRIAHE